MSKIAKVLATGKTHTTAVTPGNVHSNVNLKLTAAGGRDISFDNIVAHPTAEQLFAGAWSSCYTLALGLAAEQQKVTLPAGTSVDIEVDLGQTGDAYFLGARLSDQQVVAPARGLGRGEAPLLDGLGAAQQVEDGGRERAGERLFPRFGLYEGDGWRVVGRCGSHAYVSHPVDLRERASGRRRRRCVASRWATAGRTRGALPGR